MIAFTNLLFVPATRPDRFEKALDSGADLICIDLEDAVPADAKESARVAVLDALGTLDTSRVAVRINGLRTAEGLADLLALHSSDTKPCLLMMPMVETATEIGIAQQILGADIDGIVPLIETVAGLDNANAIARATGVAAVMFGGADFAGELGVKLEWEPLLAARSALIMASAAAKVRCIDVPYIDMSNDAGLADEAARAKALGFHAKAAIHPKQIAAIRAAMNPTQAEIEEARDAIAAFEAAGGAAVRHKGQMLEAPVIKRYKAILDTAGE